MQVGTRWAVGTTPPASLPPVVIAAVHGVEAELATTATETGRWGWTLTYLERAPIVDLDDGTRIRYLADQNHAVVTNVEFDDADPGAGPEGDEQTEPEPA